MVRPCRDRVAKRESYAGGPLSDESGADPPLERGTTAESRVAEKPPCRPFLSLTLNALPDVMIMDIGFWSFHGSRRLAVT